MTESFCQACQFDRVMASRNISGSSRHDAGDSDSDEVTCLTSTGAAAAGSKARPPRLNYGDRMPFRQGPRKYIILALLTCPESLQISQCDRALLFFNATLENR